ncbi:MULTISPECIES: PAS domain-containing protein [unclassified Neptuniibacter]|jgi:PAS domain S-box-containing protein|uniref:PAS domain-containing protein n=1 Tax=unclassified Neptuniibacter TaxID=2630693 RepID=UPI0026E29A80|nr:MULTISPECIES: PAS domain-containing protein [unclassified Neptuniibacter]MDO6513535.1 PAS domain-containing protein [Neptuniibacter sp. 2_MG-2023]MDO6593681.1 PAS domain-containing protein [Neptuniibacter sp. 1_MG-2023]
MNLLKWPQSVFNKDNSFNLDDSNLHETLFNSLGDVVMIIDQNHRISLVNTCWEKITGVAASSSHNLLFTDFLHPEDVKIWNDIIRKVFNSHGSELVWFRIISADGNIHWCEMRVQQLRPNEHYPLSATLCDITPQIRNEQIRNASHRSLQSLVNRLPAMLYRSRNNTSWSMEYVSSGCKELTGLSSEELINQPQISYGELIHEEDAGYVWNQVQFCLQTQQVFELQYRLNQANGKCITVKEKGRGLYSESGMILGVEGFVFQFE